MNVIYKPRFAGGKGLLFGVICVAAAFTLRRLEAGRLENEFPYTTFTVATAVTAWFAGWRNAAFVHAFGIVIGYWFFVTPHQVLGPFSFESAWGTAFNVMIGVVICLFTAQWQASATAARKELEERERAQKALLSAQQELRAYAGELESRVAERTHDLRDALDRLHSFTYSMVHDMRAPLRAITGFAAILEQDFDHTDEAREYLHRMRDAAQRLDQLIMDLQSYSETASREVTMEAVALDKVLSAVLDQYMEIRKSKQHIQIAGPLPVVRANRALLVQAVAHLLTNALKFVPSDREPDVRVYATEHDAVARLWIEDNGIGIKPEHQEKIFGMFQQLHARGLYPGTGMGLAIAKRAIDRMSGTIGVESKPNAGSRFWIELPLCSN